MKALVQIAPSTKAVKLALAPVSKSRRSSLVSALAFLPSVRLIWHALRHS